MSSRTFQLPESVHAWLVDTVVGESEALAALRRETFEHVDGAGMQISPEQGAFMGWLVRALGVRSIVEVGTFTGYSALAMAQALPPDGRIVCCDVSEAWTAIARRHWEAAGLSERIELRLAPALETLDALLDGGAAGTVDLVFVDADKGNYPHYVERAARLLRPGGVLAVDNSLWGGRVADPAETDPSTVAIRQVVTSVAADPRWDAALLPIGDGLLLASLRAG
jgi:predicted O-methyltransferase YrrM